MRYVVGIVLAVAAVLGLNAMASDRKIRVIVTMKVAQPATEADFESLHRRILADVSKWGVTEVRRYSHLPQSVLLVTPKALTALREHPNVLHVNEDGLSAPN